MRLRNAIKYLIYSKCPGFAGKFRYFDSNVYFPPNSMLFKALCQQGIFEYRNLRLIKEFSKPNSHIFDVGANIGLIAIPTLSLCETCTVVSFEPSPKVLPYLKRTHAESTYTDRWKIIPKAISNKENTIANFSIHGDEMSAFDGLINTNRQPEVETSQVPVSSLDAEWLALGSPNVSLIKIDVEGADFFVLQSGVQCIEKNRPVILIEWNNTNYKAYGVRSDSLLEFANTYHYKVTCVESFSTISDTSDIHMAHAMYYENFLLTPQN